MRLVRLPAALSLVLFLAAPSEAQTAPPVEAGAWRVTPFLSFTFGGGGDGDSTSLGLGAAVGYDVTSRLGVEGEFAYIFDLTGDDEFADWMVMSLGGNVLYHFPLANGSAPYATAGLVLARSRRSISDATVDTAKFGINLGGGMKASITDTLTARVDIRYFKYGDAGPDGFRVHGGLSLILRR